MDKQERIECAARRCAQHEITKEQFREEVDRQKRKIMAYRPSFVTRAYRAFAVAYKSF